ncbi:hypothetical protein LTR86_009182 [Recurvomyces mirabilis]|nr:hypothetical protein LTR86_009182 [Recurvomyces mirabilis]
MLASIARFTDDAAAIEKTLRLVQGLCTTVAALNASADAAAPWLEARSRVNLGRRYFRVFKWYPAFVEVGKSSTNGNLSTIERLLEVVKYLFLGLYFLLEASTLVFDAESAPLHINADHTRQMPWA